MSKFRQFYDKINSDAEIGAEFKKVLEEQKIPAGTPFTDLNDEQILALIPVGQKAGFEFTLEEIKAYFAKMSNDELSDDELEAVAGGKNEPLLICETLGVICHGAGVTE
jgi:predicted ribosomally synthesized peptide with nif11-like leader